MLEIRADQCTNTITSVQKDNVVIERDTETGEFPDDYIVIIDGKPCLVRKLTPKECWRLFGFTDEQFETAKKALEEKHYKGRDKASSQLYKQAGNTIVIPMLAAVLQAIKGIKAKEVQNG
jgi:site-specific DNA-cytosine methylase